MNGGIQLHGVIVALCAVTALSALSACGSAKSLTAPEYRHRANAICADLYRSRPPTTTPVKQLEWLVGRSRSALADLKALRPPPSLADLHERVVAVDSREVDFTSSLVKQVKSGDITVPAAAKAFDESSVGKGETALWQKLGVKICAESPAEYLSQHGG